MNEQFLVKKKKKEAKVNVYGGRRWLLVAELDNSHDDKHRQKDSFPKLIEGALMLTNVVY
jgi:hypothetical protein